MLILFSSGNAPATAVVFSMVITDSSSWLFIKGARFSMEVL